MDIARGKLEKDKLGHSARISPSLLAIRAETTLTVYRAQQVEVGSPKPTSGQHLQAKARNRKKAKKRISGESSLYGWVNEGEGEINP